MTWEMESTGRKTCTSATLSITALTRVVTGPNPGFRGERPLTINLSHGMTFKDHNQSKLISKFGFYLTENSLCLLYNDQSIHYVLGNKRYLVPELSYTHTACQ
jgi:hypothetical protein